MQRNNLFLTEDKADKAAYQEILRATVQAIADSINDGKAYAGPTPEELRKIVAQGELLPEKGLGFDAVLQDAAKRILPYFVRPSSMNYMAHLHSPVLLESIAAELILSTFNQSMDSWDQAPVATEMEVDVINKLCKLYGYGPESSGIFTSGGSQSNLSGLLLGRDWFCNVKLNWDVKKHGLPECYRKMRLYTSEISHFSMEKSAHLMGLGYEAVVKVPVDARMKMDAKELRKLIQADKAAGNIPFCVVATIGTTDFGSIDPIEELRGLCDEYGLWLHADAAYGSGVIMSKPYSSRIAGLNLADSLTIDFHKMFLLPISCSASLAKNAQNFDAMTIHADYLNREEDEEDGYINLVDKSLQTTRRGDAIKVWFSFRMRGKEGWSDIISTCIENAAYLYEQLEAAPDFEPLIRPEISSVVFRVLPPADSNEDVDTLNKRIRRKLLHEKGIVIGQTCWHGNVYLKFTLLNPKITHQHLNELLQNILQLTINGQ